MTDPALRHFTPADRDWLVQAHGTLYADEAGFDDSFAPLVAGIIDDFIADHDPAREAGWIVEADGQRLGCIFCVRAGETTAKLRLFLLVPQARGQGLGKRLLATCTQFARDARYGNMQLWTYQSHTAACALYAATGWRIERSEPVHSFGQDLVEQEWSVVL